MWPFKRKQPPIDCREWNDDWRAGDVAECVRPPYCSMALSIDDIPQPGQRYIVDGVVDSLNADRQARMYFLCLRGLRFTWNTAAFRKVRPVSIVNRIMDAAPGPDRVRERVDG